MEISRRFEEINKARSVGRLHVNISGCINACGHHHVGHIGLLGVEKNDKEFYQITLGGKADEDARLGQLLGPAIPYEEVTDTIERVVNRYLELRLNESELFIDTVKRLGIAPFKEALHAVH
jgi:sulfite reductase (NADPH) hemoprotein beta-component